MSRHRPKVLGPLGFIGAQGLGSTGLGCVGLGFQVLRFNIGFIGSG